MDSLGGQVLILILSGTIFGSILAFIMDLIKYRSGRKSVAVVSEQAEIELAKMIKDLAADQVRDLKDQVDGLGERVETLESGILDHVAPLIYWIQSGAQAPTPTISQELLTLMREIRISQMRGKNG